MNWSQRKGYLAGLVEDIVPEDLKLGLNETPRRSNRIICHFSMALE